MLNDALGPTGPGYSDLGAASSAQGQGALPAQANSDPTGNHQDIAVEQPQVSDEELAKAHYDPMAFDGKTYMSREIDKWFFSGITADTPLANITTAYKRLTDFHAKIDAMQPNIPQNVAEGVIRDFKIQNMPQRVDTGKDQQIQDLLRQAYGPMKGTSDVHATYADANKGQTAAMIGYALGNLIHGGGLGRSLQAAAMPVDAAQQRLLQQRAEENQNDVLHRKMLLEQLGIVQQDKQSEDKNYETAFGNWQKQGIAEGSPDYKLQKAQGDEYTRKTRRMAELDQRLGKPEAFYPNTPVGHAQHAQDLRTRYVLENGYDPYPSSHWDDLASGQTLKEQNIAASTGVRGSRQALNEEELKQLKLVDPLKVQELKRKGLIDDQKLRQLTTINKYLPAEKQAEAIKRGVDLAAARKRLNASGQWTDENGNPKTEAQARAEVTFARNDLNDQAKGFRDALAAGGKLVLPDGTPDINSYNRIVDSIKKGLAEGMQPEAIQKQIESVGFTHDEADSFVTLTQSFADNEQQKQEIIAHTRPKIKDRRGQAPTNQGTYHTPDGKTGTYKVIQP